MPTPDHSAYEARLSASGWRGREGGLSVDGKYFAEFGSVPIVSVVTTSFNSERTIERTIRSVLEQEYREVEYIIVDGGSTDGTVEIIRRYAERLSHWHSAKDQGISDAFNLGIVASRGGYIALVNSDDWVSGNQLKLAVSRLESTASAAFAFGDLRVYDVNGKLRHTLCGSEAYFEKGPYQMPAVNHPTVVVRRETYQSVGLFDIDCKVAMDYDWHLRAELAGVRGVYVPGLVGNMLSGGACDRGWDIGLAEVRDIALRRGLSPVQAHLTYVWRTSRGLGRRALSTVLPAEMMNRLHRLVNRNLTSGGGSSFR